MEKKCKSFIECQEEKILLLTKKGYPIRECKQCGHRFTQLQNADGHLDNVYSDDYFVGGKDGYPDYMREKELLYKSGLNYAKIVKKF